MAKDEEYHVMRHAKHPKGEGLHGVYQNKTRAYNTADKLDNEYGAVAHHVKRVQKEAEDHNRKHFPHIFKDNNKDLDEKRKRTEQSNRAPVMSSQKEHEQPHWKQDND